MRLLGLLLMSSVTLLSCLVIKSGLVYLMCFYLFSCLLTLFLLALLHPLIVLPHSLSLLLMHPSPCGVEEKEGDGCFLGTGLTFVCSPLKPEHVGGEIYFL